MIAFPATEAVTGFFRILHIASAIALAGGGFLWTLVLAPTLPKALAPPRVGELMRVLGPAMGRYLSLLAYTVFLSGTFLLASIWGWGQIFAVLLGGGLYGTILLSGIVAFLGGLVIGEGVIVPTGKKLVALGADASPAVAMALQRRQAIALVAVSILDFAALVAMALAVNARA